MKICIDAGHYGKYNQSPVNKKYWESEMSWKLHLLLKSELEAYGIEVITTRSAQASDLGLPARGRCAKGCDLFLSLHSDACNDPSVDRPTACCSVSGKANTLGRKLADTVARTMGTKQGGKIWNRVGSTGRDYYSVLSGANAVGVAGILMEHSFHTNLRATNWLLDDDNLRKLAQAEAACIAEHYGIQKPQQGGQTAAQTPAQAPAEQGTGYLVKVICSSLNVRAGAGVGYKVNTVVRRGEVYTIVETKQVGASTWGRLKSGAGWMNVGESYCRRI